MRFLLISDIHKTHSLYKGYDESVAVEWLLKIIDKTKPEVAVSAGDWDEGITVEDLRKIKSKVKLLTIYGNHENFSLIKNYAMSNGKIFEINGLKIAGINGLIGEKDVKKMYFTTPSEFMNAIHMIKKSVAKLDVLITHQPPYLREIYPNMREDSYSRMVFEAVEDLKPRLLFNGHMKADCYSYYQFPSGTKYLRVDSSQSCRCYGILDSGNNQVTVYEDKNEVFSLNF